MQSLSSYQWHFPQNWNLKNHNLCGNTKDPQIGKKKILREKNDARGINLPVFRLTTKLQSLRQYDTDTKQKYRPME